ncbi:hypothetical protein [Paracnuella aquatica]|uniref:hypothetical protein n=1 Tax=Paracnuella aquatica TaxID=2268757 RepID=UPI000DEEDFD3|nr:hypothetical protein [Paracnuella aquatica]RPD48214.1 hypothetical protein DRJ53_10730 [Paracnuella aquatica]
MKKLDNNAIPQEPQPDFQKAELDLLRTALKRSYTERFLVMTTLMKRSLMLKNATVFHQPAKK